MLLFSFAGAVFLLLNGPLWLVSSLRVFGRGNEASHGIVSFSRNLNRVVGVLGIITVAGLAIWLL